MLYKVTLKYILRVYDGEHIYSNEDHFLCCAVHWRTMDSIKICVNGIFYIVVNRSYIQKYIHVLPCWKFHSTYIFARAHIACEIDISFGIFRILLPCIYTYIYTHTHVLQLDHLYNLIHLLRWHRHKIHQMCARRVHSKIKLNQNHTRLLLVYSFDTFSSYSICNLILHNSFTQINSHAHIIL